MKKQEYDPEYDKDKKAHNCQEDIEMFSDLLKCKGWKHYCEYMKQQIREGKKTLVTHPIITNLDIVLANRAQESVLIMERFITYPQKAIEDAEKFFEERKKAKEGGKQ